MGSRTATSDVAILMVNGGDRRTTRPWYRRCIEAIHQHTEYASYQIYVWNNNVRDNAAVDYFTSQPDLTLVQRDDDVRLPHPHASALELLYRLALESRPRYVVSLDTDSHPVRRGWLANLIGGLDDDTVLAGIWRDELQSAIEPYVHPSCLCTTPEFIESLGLPLDHFRQNGTSRKHDSLSFLTEEAKDRGLNVYKLQRSNARNVHRVIAGIYGDLVYHHGAGSRRRILFWDEDASISRELINARIGEVTASLLFSMYDDYMRWLRGQECHPDVVRVLADLKEYKPTPREIALASARQYLERTKVRAYTTLAHYVRS